MSASEAVNGMMDNNAASIKKELDATLQRAKLLIAALAAKSPEDERENIESQYDSLREIINALA